ncbi:MAG: Gfo/Idh/MocA family protein [Roseiflexaceae bacterium]
MNVPQPHYKPVLPPIHDYGIAVIGCGGIVNYAHLPAYNAHGLHIVGCYDINTAAAQATASRHGITTVYPDLTTLLADPRVAIVDIAVPAWEQRAIATQVAAAGKHMLCQKPLAESLDDARAIQQAGAAAGCMIAVNQQMRWSAGIAASKDLIQRGYIGEPTDAQIQVSTRTPWHMWPWLRDSQHLDVMYHSIHYLDSMRHLFGDPAWVTSRHSQYPGQQERAETKTVTILDYASKLQVVVMVNHHDNSQDVYATYRILGTKGVIKGTIGLLYNYPDGRPDTLEVAQHGESLVAIPLEGLWIPDAFIGPMASLMDAIASGHPAVTSAADNIGTLQLVHGAYASASQGRSIRPADL